MTMAPQRSTGSKRTHVTTACTPCRESKAKCDGATPQCRRCTTRGINCHYKTSEDRRKVSLRGAIGLLVGRTQQLTEFIESHGLGAPPMKSNDDASRLSSVLESLGLTSTHSSGCTTMPDDQTDIPVPQDDDESARGLTGSTLEGETGSHIQIPSIPRAGADGVVDELSDRVGAIRFRPGGHIYFFGSTSNFNLLDTPADTGLSLKTVRSDGPHQLKKLDLQKDIPSSLEEHLVSLYFAWQDPSTHVVDRAIFETAKDQWRNQQDTAYYSESLLNIICAVGGAFDCRHHPDLVTFPRSLSEFFAERSKALLEIEIDQPSVATVQSLVILSSYEMGRGNYARGWLFSGMALRLCRLLALHQDLSSYIPKGLLSESEANLRRTVFWAANFLDCIWSRHVGQPFQESFGDVSVTKHGPIDDPASRWSPYSAPNSNPYQLEDYVEGVAVQQYLLFDCMNPLSHVLYSNTPIQPALLRDLSTNAVNNLHGWKSSLPPVLRVDLDSPDRAYLPHVLLMHMQYYQSIIYAYRPWMSKRYAHSLPSQSGDAAHEQQACIDAALNSARLLRLYEMQYGLRRVNFQAVSLTFSASLILLYASLRRDGQDTQNEFLVHLGVCFRVLDELSLTWESAKRTLDVLTRLQHRWEARSRQTHGPPAASTQENAFSRRNPGWTSSNPPSDGDVLGDGLDLAGSAVQERVDADFDFDIGWLLNEGLLQPSNRLDSFFSVPSADFIAGPDDVNVLGAH